MSDYGAIYLGMGAYLIATISPGPATLAIMGVAAQHGRSAGLRLASGIMCGSLFWGLCAAFGLATILARFSHLLVAIKWLGAAYLMWLAYKALRSAASPAGPLSANGTVAGGNYVLQGLAIHLTNPKAVLAWVAILSIGVQSGAPAWHSLAMFGGCALLGVMVFCGYALLFSTKAARTWYAAARRPFDAVLGLVFGAAALKLLTSEE